MNDQSKSSQNSSEKSSSSSVNTSERLPNTEPSLDVQTKIAKYALYGVITNVTLAVAAGATAIFTAYMEASSFKQIDVMNKQFDQMKKSNDRMDRAIEVAKSQSDSMNKQIELMKKNVEQVERSIDAADRQAQAAEIANNQTKENLNSQIRAYIDVQNQFFKDEPYSYISTVSFKNYGQTPAYNIRYTTYTALLDLGNDDTFNTPTRFDTTSCKAGMISNGIGLGTGDIIDVRSVPVNQDGNNIDDIRGPDIKKLDGASILVSWGVICYTDIFNNIHGTTFCSTYNKYGVVNNLRNACEKGNEHS